MGWLHFTEHYDHRFESGASAEYNAGGTYFVKRDIEEEALRLGVAEKVKKPDADDKAHHSPPARHDSAKATFADRREVKSAKRGGVFPDGPGNPVSLPDPADPDALRSEPITEKNPAVGVAGSGGVPDDTDEHDPPVENESVIETE